MSICIDSHVHSTHSRHRTPNPATIWEYAQRACEIGLRRIYLTEHVELDNDHVLPLRVEEYRKEMEAVREAYAGKLEVMWGAEFGMTRATVSRLPGAVLDVPLDYAIASIHGDIPNCPIFHIAENWKGLTKGEVQKIYLREMLHLLPLMDTVDCVGHITYYSRWCPFEQKEIHYADAPDEFDELFKYLIARGCGMEANTSTLFSDGFCLPDLDIFQRYRELGGEIVTIGSDAHAVAELGRGLDGAAAMLRKAGFTHYASYVARKPIFYPLL